MGGAITREPTAMLDWDINIYVCGNDKELSL